MSGERKAADIFRAKRFGVEHALSMYAYSYVNLPAVGLYDKEALQPFAETTKSCHIYFIGYLPRVSVSGSEQLGRTVSIHLDCLGERKSVSWEFPEGACLRKVDEFWFVEAQDGQRYAPTTDQILKNRGQSRFFQLHPGHGYEWSFRLGLYG